MKEKNPQGLKNRCQTLTSPHLLVLILQILSMSACGGGGGGAFVLTASCFLRCSGVLVLSAVLAEQEGENLSGLSTNPDKAIFAVRENATTCLMVEFAVKFIVPYDVLALNGIDVRNSPHLVHCDACESELRKTG